MDEIIQTFNAKLPTHKIKLVGECVRDLLCGGNVYGCRIPERYEFATTAFPEQILNVFDGSTEEGTVTVTVNNEKFLISTLKFNGKYTSNWEANATNLDFTINAMYMDYSKYMSALYELKLSPKDCKSEDEIDYIYKQSVDDYFGGYKDLLEGNIRFIVDEEYSIENDPICILKYFRYFSIFGKQHDPEIIQNIKKYAHYLERVPASRIAEEFKKLEQLETKDVFIDMSICQIPKYITHYYRAY
jgi:poly(A) polymerase